VPPQSSISSSIRPIAKNPSTHPLQNSLLITYSTLQTSQPSHIRQLLTIQPPGSTRSSYLSLSRPPVSSSLKFCNRSFAYAAPTLWNGLPIDLRQFAHIPNPRLNFTYPPLALSSPTFHSRLKTELFKNDLKQNSLRYPIPAPLLHHHTSAIITNCNRSTTLFPRFDLPGF